VALLQHRTVLTLYVAARELLQVARYTVRFLNRQLTGAALAVAARILVLQLRRRCIFATHAMNATLMLCRS
jgi:hypothetical protein